MASHRLFVMNIYKLVGYRLLTKAPAGQASIHLTESHTCSSDIMVKNHQYFSKLLSGICQKGWPCMYPDPKAILNAKSSDYGFMENKLTHQNKGTCFLGHSHLQPL